MPRSSCSPRSSNSSPEPTTRSRTVPDTRTSAGASPEDRVGDSLFGPLPAREPRGDQRLDGFLRLSLREQGVLVWPDVARQQRWRVRSVRATGTGMSDLEDSLTSA